MASNRAVTIEPQAPSHAGALYDVLRDLQIYTFLDDLPPSSAEALEQRIIRLLEGAPDGSGESWYNWTVFVDETVAGYTQATVYDDGRADLAYVISPECWGQSIAYKASLLTIEQMKTIAGVRQIIADTECGNIRSQRLLDRLGFAHSYTQGNDMFFSLPPH